MINVLNLKNGLNQSVFVVSITECCAYYYYTIITQVRIVSFGTVDMHVLCKTFDSSIVKLVLLIRLVTVKRSYFGSCNFFSLENSTGCEITINFNCFQPRCKLWLSLNTNTVLICFQIMTQFQTLFQAIVQYYSKRVLPKDWQMNLVRKLLFFHICFGCYQNYPMCNCLLTL